MKTLIFILATLIIIGCNKDKNEAVCATAELIFINESGEDIFNSSTQNNLSISEFEVYAEDSLNRLNFVEQTNSGNIFDIWVYGEKGLEGGNTYLKLGNLTVDTIYAKFKEKGNSIFISELYYNGILLDNNSNVTECSDTIFKIRVKTN